MAKKNEEKFNVYRFAGEAGKVVKKYGGHALAAVGIFLFTNGPDIIKKIKK